MLQLTRALKDLPNRIQTASKNERREVIQNVVTVLSNPGRVLYKNYHFVLQTHTRAHTHTYIYTHAHTHKKDK